MDKITKYKELASTIIDGFDNSKNPNQTIERLLIKDEKRGHYLVFSDGWIDNKKRVYGLSVHIEVTEAGKIWVREDTTTDPPVTTILLERGVPKEDIVLAFYPPTMRVDTGFAVA